MRYLLRMGVGVGNNETTILGPVRETEGVPARELVAGSCLRLATESATSC